MDKHIIKLTEATLLILNKKPWSSISMDEIYKKSKVNKKNFCGKTLNKRELLRNIIRYVDVQLKNSSNVVDISSHKDMIFEVMMMRFDILQNYRKSIIRIFDFFKRKPQELVLLLPSFIESMILMASLAKISINGLKGNLKIKGLLVVYFSSFLVWTKDNSKSLDKTMQSLDNKLDRAGNLLKILKI